jgi:hypothetical protein
VNVAASSAGLVAQYNYLLHSATFQQLNRLVTQNQNIILRDSSLLPGQPTGYGRKTHRIFTPLNTPTGTPRPLIEVRDDILWEMHNASMRGAVVRTHAKFDVPPPGSGASLEEKKRYLYMRAARALSFEWVEWINIAEHDLRAQAINRDPTMGAGPHVTRTYAHNFAVPDQGWYNFETYLEVQILRGHSNVFDANVDNRDWAGKKILARVKSASPAAMYITQKQEQEWLNGKRTKIKSASNNPFMSLDLSSLVWN